MTLSLTEGEQVTVYSIEMLKEVLGKAPDMAALRDKAEADFAAHQARWDAAAEETGYTAAFRAEREAGDKMQDLLQAFSTTPATTLAGVAGKLDAVLREGEAWEECSAFPWPQIRSALSDVVRMPKPLVLIGGGAEGFATTKLKLCAIPDDRRRSSRSGRLC